MTLQFTLMMKVNNVENEAVSWIRLSDYRILTNGLITFTTDKVPSLLATVLIWPKGPDHVINSIGAKDTNLFNPLSSFPAI